MQDSQSFTTEMPPAIVLAFIVVLVVFAVEDRFSRV
jgi:hypothetical protein